jgi:hypothetical protein
LLARSPGCPCGGSQPAQINFALLLGKKTTHRKLGLAHQTLHYLVENFLMFNFVENRTFGFVRTHKLYSPASENTSVDLGLTRISRGKTSEKQTFLLPQLSACV